MSHARDSNAMLVAVVDDDESVRESLPDLLRMLGYSVIAFASADEFLASGRVADAKCLILDVVMAGMSGPELQCELARRGMTTPVVFVTGRGNGNVRQSLVQRGAIACLFKPFSEAELKSALSLALPHS